MRKFLIISFILSSSLWHSNGQSKSTEKTDVSIPGFAPMEDVFIHFNSSLLLTGEYFYYKVYCLLKEDEKLSEFSKIAYVELIAEDGKKIFSHKVKLNKGLGNGDFFIPASVPSGNYKLIGYTNWMRNRKNSPFFSSDVFIINPYQGRANQEEAKETAETGINPEKGSISQQFTDDDLPATLQLELNETTFGQRARVSMSFLGPQNKTPQGNISISVRKKEKIQEPEIQTALNYTKQLSSAQDHWEESEKIFLPEFRGEIISGKISPQKDAGDLALNNQKLSLSIPGENYFLRMARPDENGRFHFIIDDSYSGDRTFIQVLGEDQESIDMNLDSISPIDHTRLAFNDFQVSSEMEKMIIERSVYNQIENGYFSVKPDTIPLEKPNEPFYGSRMEWYDLDEYNRFKTLEQTVVEIIRFTRLVTDDAGRTVFATRGFDLKVNPNTPAMLIIDGIHVQDHALALKLSANEIKSIGVVRDKYFFGPTVFQGILEINTISGDFDPTLWDNQIKTSSIQQPQAKKNYFQQKYNSSEDSLARIPDLRYQLLWEPDFKLNNQNQTVDFYTSDVPGTYEISVEGFTSEGAPISAKKTITVE